MYNVGNLQIQFIDTGNIQTNIVANELVKKSPNLPNTSKDLTLTFSGNIFSNFADYEVVVVSDQFYMFMKIFTVIV